MSEILQSSIVSEAVHKRSEQYFRGLLDLGILRDGEIRLEDCRLACYFFARADVAKTPPVDAWEKELIGRFCEQLNHSGLLDIEADGRTLSEITIGLVYRIRKNVSERTLSAAELEKVREEVEAFYSLLGDRNSGTKWAADDDDYIEQLEGLDNLRYSLKKVRLLAESICDDIGYPLE